MTDGAFFLKAPVPKDLPPGTKGIGLEPSDYGFECGGKDIRCSTAYAQMWQHFGGSSGVVKRLRQKYGIDGRVAFVGFSAALGFLQPLLNNDADRADIAAVFLIDSTFGTSYPGYVKAAKDAAAGKMTLVTTTSNTGGDAAWQKAVLAPSGLSLSRTSPVPPMPEPSGGVYNSGDLWYYKFVDAKGGTELPHWEMGKTLSPVLRAHLWREAPDRGTSRLKLVFLGLTLAAGLVYLFWPRWRDES